MGKSRAWDHFTIKSSDLAQCNTCSKVIGVKGGSTSGLLRHLRLKHGVTNVCSSSSSQADTPAKSPATANTPTTPSTPKPVGDTQKRPSSSESKEVGLKLPKQQKLNFPVKQEFELTETLAKLAAIDGFSFH